VTKHGARATDIFVLIAEKTRQAHKIQCAGGLGILGDSVRARQNAEWVERATEVVDPKLAEVVSTDRARRRFVDGGSTD